MNQCFVSRQARAGGVFLALLTGALLWGNFLGYSASDSKVITMSATILPPPPAPVLVEIHTPKNQVVITPGQVSITQPNKTITIKAQPPGIQVVPVFPPQPPGNQSPQVYVTVNGQTISVPKSTTSNTGGLTLPKSALPTGKNASGTVTITSMFGV